MKDLRDMKNQSYKKLCKTLPIFVVDFADKIKDNVAR